MTRKELATPGRQSGEPELSRKCAATAPPNRVASRMAVLVDLQTNSCVLRDDRDDMSRPIGVVKSILVPVAWCDP